VLAALCISEGIMNEADLINLFLESSQALDSNFEFFLTVSFAVIVASYLITEKIPFPVFLITISLYLVSTILFMIRGATMGRTLTSIRDQLDAMNSEISLISANENLLVAGLYFVTMIAGSLTTIAFVYWRFRKLRGSGTA
jgi:hypothetical protein